MLTRIAQIDANYWVDIWLLAGVAAITVALTVIHLIDRRRKRKRSRPPKAGGVDYEKPPFPVDYGHSNEPADGPSAPSYPDSSPNHGAP